MNPGAGPAEHQLAEKAAIRLGQQNLAAAAGTDHLRAILDRDPHLVRDQLQQFEPLLCIVGRFMDVHRRLPTIP
jgi:hypothetical protein